MAGNHSTRPRVLLHIHINVSFCGNTDQRPTSFQPLAPMHKRNIFVRSKRGMYCTSLAHSGVSFAGLFTRVLTGYA